MTEISSSAGRGLVPRMARLAGTIAAVILALGAASASTAVAAAAPVATASVKAAAPAHVPLAAAGLKAARIARPGQASPQATGTNDYLNTDSCTGANFCMAVGAYNLAGATPALSEVLSGGAWVSEPVPSPATGVNIFANEVSCASATSCLFVGDHWSGKTGPTRNLAEFWNGQSWRIVTATGPYNSGLDDVACPTATLCLAVGVGGSARSSYDTAYTWTNGTTWRRIAVPNPAHARNSELGGLACFSSSNCMAVGDYTSASGHVLPFAVQWHSGHWTLLSAPAVRGPRKSYFEGVSCPTSTRCVAVGETENAGYLHAFAEVWSAGKWHLSTVRWQQSGFIGVSCPARNRCYAAGWTYPSSSAAYSNSLIETWNGQTWTTQHLASTPKPYPGDDLIHVSCVSTSNCEAVGERYQPAGAQNSQTLAVHWNGTRWTVQTTPNP